MSRFLVVGLGHFGSWAAQTLYQMGHEVIGIDANPTVVDRHAEMVTRGIVGDATDPALLADLGADGVDAAILSTGENLAASVLVAQALKDLHVREIFVKVASHEAARVFESIGVSDTVFPARQAALRLAHRISSKAVFDYLPLSRGYSMQEVAIPDQWIGHSLRDLELPKRHGINVVALYDVLTDTLQPVPDPDTPLKESDLAIVVGRDDTIAKVLRVDRTGG
ncbi:MAG: TrkA family potassium uptake protein [Gemmatimonadota bacterium]|nr:TrkA family potassium uptake protein [Gemmatimonadota bacterium]MDH3369389.1 TrkA family potassium uptake protein [Gemmatimonadota bacterium]MDH3477295.1 TrkA family potassium uptake protein [Gemmatimonadota bacterium]MDH3571532.1 TrkA family potassium uptake protein [Gemmatimonadota bacterium]MDH5550853.1 TrkA family potassium uptake protein [Gemmatimonadota bacterium]